MNDSFAADEVLLDVPEQVETDPFEDVVTEEIVELDLIRLDLSDVEVVWVETEVP